MATKDQCDKCRYQIDGICKQLVPSNVGTSCPHYAKHIDLRKKNDVTAVPSPVINDDYEDNTTIVNNDNSEGITQSAHEDIHGWLLFFLIAFVGIRCFVSLGALFTLDYAEEILWVNLFTVTVVLGYAMSGIFTIVAFKKRDTDAVFLGKTYIIFGFIISLFGLVFGEPAERETSRAISSAIWCVIWYVFFFTSKQIKEQIPVRKTKTRDWILIGAIILLPMILLGIGIAEEEEAHYHEDDTEIYLDYELLDNQYSDGRIVLTVPDGVDCDGSVVDGTKVFSISDPETGTEVTVASDYDNEISKKQFNQYWRGWKLEELNDIGYKVIEDRKNNDGDITVFYKMIRTTTEYPVDWEFAVIFDKSSGKVCVVSGYSNADDGSPVGYIINNLRFL